MIRALWEPIFRWIHEGFLVQLVRLGSDLGVMSGSPRGISLRRVFVVTWAYFGSQILDLHISGNILHHFDARKSGFVCLKVLIGKDLGINWIWSSINRVLWDNDYRSQSNLREMERRIFRVLFRIQKLKKFAGLETDLILESEELLRVEILDSSVYIEEFQTVVGIGEHNLASNVAATSADMVVNQIKEGKMAAVETELWTESDNAADAEMLSPTKQVVAEDGTESLGLNHFGFMARLDCLLCFSFIISMRFKHDSNGLLGGFGLIGGYFGICKGFDWWFPSVFGRICLRLNAISKLSKVCFFSIC